MKTKHLLVTFLIVSLVLGVFSFYKFGINLVKASATHTLDNGNYAHGTSDLDSNYQSKIHYANGSGRWFVWYVQQPEDRRAWATSVDGSTWTVASFYGEQSVAIAGYYFDVWYDSANNKECIATRNQTDSGLWYNQGTSNSDGSITWDSSGVQISSETPYSLTLCKDSDGYPWVAYRNSSGFEIVRKATATDGSSWGSSTALWSTAGAGIKIVPLTDGKMLSFLLPDFGDRAKSRLFNGTSWESEVYVTTNNLYSPSKAAAVADGDNAHFVFENETNYYIKYVKYTYGVGWGSAENVDAGNQSDRKHPCITLKATDEVRVFFITNLNTTKYRDRIGGSWNSATTISDAENGVLGMSSSTMAFSNKSGIVWLNNKFVTGCDYYPIRFVGYGLVTITNPQNTTYDVSTIPVEFSAEDGTIDKKWYNCLKGSDWVYTNNVTYTSSTEMTGFSNGAYTFYAWANNTEGEKWQAIVYFTVAIPASPTYSDVAYSQTMYNYSCTFSVKVADVIGLDKYVFGTNNTGSWVNGTATAFSGNPAWANVTKTLNGTVGNRIEFCWWFNDTSSLTNTTGIHYLVVSDYTPTKGGAIYEIQKLVSAINWTADLATSYQGIILGNVTLTQFQTLLDACDNSSWQDILKWYAVLKKYSVENETTIKRALDNSVMLSNGLPKTEIGNTFHLYKRYCIYGYYWADKFLYQQAKWNTATAYVNFNASVEYCLATYGYAPLWIFDDNHGGGSFGRFYDEYAETLDAYLEFYQIGVSAALEGANRIWDWLNNEVWTNAGDTGLWHYGYHTGALNIWECEAGGFEEVVWRLYYWNSSISNSSRLTTDCENRFLSSNWSSPQWSYPGVVGHAGATTEGRLENTEMAYAAILGLYANMSESDRLKIKLLLNGYYDMTDNMPAWALLNNTQSALYDSDSGKYRWVSGYTPTDSATACAANLILNLAMIPDTASLAIPLEELWYEYYLHMTDYSLYGLDLTTRTVKLSIYQGGYVTFEFGYNPFTHLFSDAGIYNVTFASDWNSITNSTLLSALPTNRYWLGSQTSCVTPTIGEFQGPTTAYPYQSFMVNITVQDANGKADLKNCVVSLNASSIDLTWIESDNSTAIVDPSNYGELVSSTVATVNSTAFKITWAIKLYWNATEGTIGLDSNSEVFDDSDLSASTTTGSFVFEDDLIVNSASVDDSRVNPSQNITFTGQLYHEGTLTAPENTTGITAKIELGGTIKGSTAVINATGHYQISFNAESSVANYSYTVYAVTDQNTVQNKTVYVCVDKNVITITANTTSPAPDEIMNCTITATYSFDGSPIAAFTVNTCRNSTHFALGNFTDSNGAGTLCYYTIENFTEPAYGLTTSTSNTLTVYWSDYLALTVKALDSNGNVMAGATVNFDTTHNQTTDSNGLATLTGIVANTNVSVRILWQATWVNGTWATNVTTTKTVEANCKVYSLTLWITDLDGNEKSGASLTLTRTDGYDYAADGLSPATPAYYNSTHARHVWNQLANQTSSSYTAFASYAGKTASEDTALTENTIITLLIPYTVPAPPTGGSNPGTSGTPTPSPAPTPTGVSQFEAPLDDRAYIGLAVICGVVLVAGFATGKKKEKMWKIRKSWKRYANWD